MARRSQDIGTSITPERKKRLERIADQVGLKKSDIIRMGTIEKMDDLDPQTGED